MGKSKKHNKAYEADKKAEAKAFAETDASEATPLRTVVTLEEAKEVVPQSEPVVLVPELLAHDHLEEVMADVLMLRAKAFQEKAEREERAAKLESAKIEIEKVRNYVSATHAEHWKAFLAAHPGMDQWIYSNDPTIKVYRHAKEKEINLAIAKTDAVMAQYVELRESVNTIQKWLDDHGVDWVKTFADAKQACKKEGLDYDVIFPRKEVMARR